ncbi:MAG: sigma-70 family RNA polymerase sigma factor [Pseudomonadales bacterium]|nr:sigma-70 family RNA polymerase sigma factor [Pseudomonadales bacterium]
MTDYEIFVQQAQAGDHSAYTRLVMGFQDIAKASAYAWLGDHELARDVAQEAFLEAYLNLSQLKSAAAFPGWLRRIVIKHCDRQTRRKSFMTTSESTDIEQLSVDSSPLLKLLSAEKRHGVRRAVEALPENVRITVALHYFGGASGQEMADFLELPLSTVKKRLRVARDKLREKDMNSMEKITKAPSSQFPDEIAMFIAIREGDLRRVESLLDRSPDLINAEQNWQRELVYNGVLPFATKATPLITAIEISDLALQKLLVDKGADVNGKCGCATGEPPLWTAALLNRAEHVQHLLEHGAEPDVRSASGNTSLHVAAMRGYTNIVHMLMESGADATLVDDDSEAIWPLTAGAQNKEGWRAVDWARHNDHHEIVTFLEVDHEIRPSILDELNVVADDTRVHTGIKALDFFAPISKGSLIRLPFKAGVGMMVLLGELSQCFLSLENGDVVWTGFTQPPFDLSDLEAEMDEFGLRDQINVVLASYQESLEDQHKTFMDGLGQLESMRDSGKDVLAVIQSVEGFESAIEENLLRLVAESSAGSITSIVLTPFRDEEQAWDQLRAPYSSQISLDRNRALRNLYPAIDPLRSMSSSDRLHLSEQHKMLLEIVTGLFRSRGDLSAIFDAEEEVTADIKCQADLISYLTQPFRITEPFRGTPGQSVSTKSMLDGIQAILKHHQIADS